MEHTHDCDHVISKGTLRNGAVRVDYYTTMPAPNQWVAVGVMSGVSHPRERTEARKLVVGNGFSEASAVADLKRHADGTLAVRSQTAGDRLIPAEARDALSRRLAEQSSTDAGFSNDDESSTVQH
jgi:hypothetical protein